jgi:hypothetical protein
VPRQPVDLRSRRLVSHLVDPQMNQHRYLPCIHHLSRPGFLVRNLLRSLLCDPRVNLPRFHRANRHCRPRVIRVSLPPVCRLYNHLLFPACNRLGGQVRNLPVSHQGSPVLVHPEGPPRSLQPNRPPRRVLVRVPSRLHNPHRNRQPNQQFFPLVNQRRVPLPSHQVGLPHSRLYFPACSQPFIRRPNHPVDHLLNRPQSRVASRRHSLPLVRLQFRAGSPPLIRLPNRRGNPVLSHLQFQAASLPRSHPLVRQYNRLQVRRSNHHRPLAAYQL